VFLVPEVATAPVATLGAFLQQHAWFPARVNVGFMQVLDSTRIRLRVFERGVGETSACGTGACAAVAVGRRWGRLAARVTVELSGGELQIEWPGAGETLFMTGAAARVFEGTIDL
jgi:diaminopimelate epimerase